MCVYRGTHVESSFVSRCCSRARENSAFSVKGLIIDLSRETSNYKRLALQRKSLNKESCESE